MLVDTVPYHREGRGGTPEGGSWPQGKPGVLPRPTSVAGFEAEHTLLVEAQDLLREVLRSPKAYRGIKAVGEGSLHIRYTALEVTDDLAQRIALAVVGATQTSPYDHTEQVLKPGLAVRSTLTGRHNVKGVLVRKVLGVSVDAWFVDVEHGGCQCWVEGSFVVEA